MKKKSCFLVGFLLLSIFISGCTNTEEAGKTSDKEALVKKAEESLAERPIIYASGNFMGLMDTSGTILMDGEKERIAEINAFSNSTLMEYIATTHDVFYINTDSYQIFPENPDFRIHSQTFENSKYGSYKDPELEKYGLVLNDGTVVKEAKDMPAGISEVIFRNSSFAYVHFKDRTYGLMNSEGNLLLKDIKSLDYLEEEGKESALAVLRIDGEYGIVHEKNGLVLAPEEAKSLEIKKIFPYGQRSTAIYETEEGKYGLINQEGNVIYEDEEPLVFTSILPFSEKGLALAESYKDDFVINEAGEVVTVIAEQVEEEVSITNGFLDDDTILVSLGKFGDRSYGLMNEKFEVIERFSTNYETMPTYMGNGLFSIAKAEKSAYPTIIDRSGKEVLSQKKAEEKGIYSLSKFTDSGLSIFRTKEHDQGLVNHKGEVLIESKSGSELGMEKRQNIYQVTASSPGAGHTKHYYDKDGQLFFQSNKNEQIFLSKELIMVVKPDGETDIHDENGYLIKTVKANMEE